MKKIPVNQRHMDAYQAILAEVRRHEAELSPAEMLCVLGNMTGKLIAISDDEEYAIELVTSNITNGRREAKAVIDSILQGHEAGNA